MEASRLLFTNKYPDDPEISVAFIADISSEDSFCKNIFSETSSKLYYEILLGYQQIYEKYKETERKGQEALRSLRERNRLDDIKRKYYSKTKNIEVIFRSPIQKKIYPQIQIIISSEIKIFDIFPTLFRNDIFWQTLKHIEPTNVKNIMYTLNPNESDEKSSIDHVREYILGESNLGKEKINIRKCRGNAINAIDKVIEIIQEYEEKWVIPIN
jgi:hypothetical protein